MKELLQHLKCYTVVKRQPPLNPEHVKEIRYILQGVKSGELLHNQKTYHKITDCGTAHCIAGWKCHLDAAKAGLDITDYAEMPNISDSESITLKEFLAEELDYEPGGDYEWEYAETKWELTLDETWVLFDADATLEAQFELLELLEAGYTIKDDDND